MISYPVSNFLNTFYPNLNMDKQISQWYQLVDVEMFDGLLIAGWFMISYVSFPEDFRRMAWFKGKITGTLPIFIGKTYGFPQNFPWSRSATLISSEAKNICAQRGNQRVQGDILWPIIAMGFRWPIYRWFTYEKWWFSIAMLVITRWYTVLFLFFHWMFGFEFSQSRMFWMV